MTGEVKETGGWLRGGMGFGSIGGGRNQGGIY